MISHIVRLWILIIPLTLTAYYLFSSTDYLPIPSLRHFSDDSPEIDTSPKSIFIAQVLEHGIDGPIDDTPLTAFCADKKWRPGLMFKCEAATGGVANVRNQILNCVRYALEAGGNLRSFHYHE